MTYSPDNLIKVRRIYQRYTKLPAVALGIQHYQPDGGGYHEGNDLLAAAGRLTSDYSKRESALDRPGSNAASAIDIGYFDVRLPNGRRVTLRDRSAWVLAHWAEAPWLRELIYSPDGKVVKRKDRLGIRTTGDRSHLSHDHESYHRDFENDPRIPAFHQRFWDEMNGISLVKKGRRAMWVVQLNLGSESSWWKTDTLRREQLLTWPRVLWHCARYGQEPYDFQFSDVVEFNACTGRTDTEVDPNPVGVNIAPSK